MTKVLYYGWLGNRNLGDETLFHVNRLLFKGIALHPRGSLLERLVPMKACILGGGTYINENVSAPSFLNLQRRMPLLIFGAGVQNPSFWSTIPGYVDGREDWNRILERSPFVTVRGPHSLKTLEEQGFKRAEIAGDPVLSLARDRPTGRHGLRVGVNFGDTQGLLWGRRDDKVRLFFHELIGRLRADGLELSLFSVCPSDTEAMRDAQEAYSLEMHVHYRYSAAVLNYFDNVDIFVGMKLHSTILAHCAYTPSLMIEYRPKCADYMASMGLEGFNIRCDQATVEDALSLIEKLRQEAKDHQEHLYRRVARHRETQKRAVQEIIRYLRGL